MKRETKVFYGTSVDTVMRSIDSYTEKHNMCVVSMSAYISSSDIHYVWALLEKQHYE